MKPAKIYMTMSAGALVGVVAAFLQTLEKLQLLRHPSQPLSCDLGSWLSCSNVLNAWQSSVFGFPNSIMCLALFLVFLVAAIAGWSGSALSRGFRSGVHGLALFTLAFSLWFLEQSTFVIGSLCIYCVFCFLGLLVVNWAWLRRNVADLPLRPAHKRRLNNAIANGADSFGWLLLGLAVAFTIVITLG